VTPTAATPANMIAGPASVVGLSTASQNIDLTKILNKSYQKETNPQGM